MRDREAVEGEDVGLGVLEQRGDLREPAVEVRDRLGEPIAGLRKRVGVEDRPDQRAQQAVLVLAGVAEAVAEEVDGAALPGAAQDLRDRGLQTRVRVADGELDTDQPALDQAAQERGPERLGLGLADVDGEISRRPVSWTPCAITSALFTTRPPARTFSIFASRNRYG